MPEDIPQFIAHKLRTIAREYSGLLQIFYVFFVKNLKFRIFAG